MNWLWIIKRFIGVCVCVMPIMVCQHSPRHLPRHWLQQRWADVHAAGLRSLFGLCSGGGGGGDARRCDRVGFGLR